MKKLLLISGIILTFGLLQSCYNSTGNKPVGLQINGKVIDSDKNTGVEGVIITTEPATTMNLTDANGNFSINVDQSGTYTVYAKKTGYSNGSASVKVTENLSPQATIFIRDVKNINKPPNKPVYTNPEDGDSTEFKSVTLQWEGSDPDGNSLKYDVYFGTTNPPTIAVARDIAVTSYTIDSLQENTTYYWKIVAKDDYESTDGDIWSFKIYKSNINTNGLIAYYPFKGNANDESSNHHDGTVYNAVLDYDRNGNANSAYRFDGLTSYIKVPFSTDFEPVGDLTIMAWVKPDVANSHPYDTHIDIISRVGSNSSIHLGITTNLALEFWSFHGPSNEFLGVENPKLNNTWNHIAMVFKHSTNTDRGTIFLYLNGNLIGQKSMQDLAIDPTADYGFGYRINSQYLSRYAGLIDEIYFYKKALTAEEIRALSK